MLRCAQIGISISELENITLGMAYDIMTEYNNDDYNYPYIATQEDMDRL
nr:MAG TPA: hypothetical protein [Caudoviricetes sp.]